MILILVMFILFVGSLNGLIENPNTSSFCFFALITFLIIIAIYFSYEKIKTGEVNQYESKKKLKDCNMERSKILIKYTSSDTELDIRDMRSEMNDIDEKYCRVGSKAYEEVEEKKKRWENGGRW